MSAAEPFAPPADDARLIGFQLTFFRIRTGLGEGLAGRFAPRQLLFAHAALSEIGAARHRHAERLARWSGQDDPGLAARALRADADIAVGGWTLRRQDAAARSASSTHAAPGMDGPGRQAVPADPDPSGAPENSSAWHTSIDGGEFAFDLALRRTQPVLLQGDAGFSRKGPDEAQASHYLSEPQLAVAGRLRLGSEGTAGPANRRGGDTASHAAASPSERRGGPWVRGTAWLDQEWSDELLHPDAVGWDWIGINLLDGSALTAFRLRRADGSALWAGGSFRQGMERASGIDPVRALGPVRAFAPGEVRFIPGRRWRSPASDADYPVEWQVHTPAGRFTVQALLDAQEIGGRTATGTTYWEGLSALLDDRGRRVGLGYLEMTGYAGRLRLPG